MADMARSALRVRHQRDLEVPMADSTVLLADRWAPAGLHRGPTVLVRSPYGRRGAWGALYGRPLAAAGWSVVVASVRGTSSPSDRFDEPMVHEASDGAATVAWLRRQPWWDGRLATIGMSYLGYCAWALATNPLPELRAMVVQVGPHEMASVNWPGGAFALADSLGWAQLLGGPWRQPGLDALRGARRRRRSLDSALSAELRGRPAAAALAATGGQVGWWEGWAGHGPDDAWWSAYDCSAALEAVGVPVLLQGGWQDVFRRAVIHQHSVLVGRGVPVGLTMGPWTHTGMVAAWPVLLAEAIGWLQAAFSGVEPAGAGEVRTVVVGSDPHRPLAGALPRWRRWPSWPPPARSETWHLGPGATLQRRPAGVGAGPLARIRWDPADPTPQVGGALLGPGGGPRDQREVESRRDVACFTGPPLGEDLEVAGTVTAEVTLRAYGPHHLMVRLCDVDSSGRSVNVCDGITAVADPSGTVEVDLGPIAARWATGHRLRLQVTGGAHPRWSGHPRPATLDVVAGDLRLPVVG